MGKRLEIVRDILWRPIWFFITLIWGIVSNVPTVISLVGVIINQNLTSYAGVLMKTSLFHFLSVYWIPFLVIGYLAAVAEGIYIRARGYLGERIIARKITLLSGEETLSKDSLYAYVLVQNDENYNLEDCQATIKTIKVKIDGNWVDKTTDINPNYAPLTWPRFKKEENKVVGSLGKERVNIVKYVPNTFAFIFEDGDRKATPFNDFEYYIEVVVKGKMNGKFIEDKLLHGFIRYSSEMHPFSYKTDGTIDLKTGEISYGKEVEEYYAEITKLNIEPGEINDNSKRE